MRKTNKPKKPTVPEIIATMEEIADAWRDDNSSDGTIRGVKCPDALHLIACLRAGIKVLRQTERSEAA